VNGDLQLIVRSQLKARC
jgi:hypothetical protein